MATERDQRVYVTLMELTVGMVDVMGSQIEEQAGASGGMVEISANVAALFKVAFHMGLRVGLSDIGQSVYDAIEAMADKVGGMPPGTPLDLFREALSGEEPGPVH